MTLPDWEDKTILVVEDDEISMEFLTELLSPSKVTILSAINGQQAVEICAADGTIDLVLMDVRLPILNGKEAMQEIKKQCPEKIVIAQTAFAMSGDKERYLKLGFDNYISKPIVMADLIELISTYFS